MAVSFAKLEGAGNGYLAVDGRAPVHADTDWPRVAREMTRERVGAGSDGLLVAGEARGAEAAIAMRVLNSDGSEAEMSGNGIRLFAKFVLDRDLAPLRDCALVVETLAGLRRVWPQGAEGACGMSAGRVAMGVPSFDAAALPMMAEPGESLLEVPLEVAGRSLRVTCLSVGNPHAVLILDEPVDDFPLAEIGPLVQQHPRFPRRVNFEIVNVLGPGRLRARIYERGEGETLASGTGSTACAVAARVRGLGGDRYDIELRGGRLRVSWGGVGEAWLEGPVREVYRGLWPL